MDERLDEMEHGLETVVGLTHLQGAKMEDALREISASAIEREAQLRAELESKIIH